jgi:branched-chain amino acid transport system permease protein
LNYPVYRLFLSTVCLGIAGGLYLLVNRTRLGMRIRAGAANSEMVQVLGINTKILFTTVFCIGVTLTALAGILAAPVESVYPGIGEQVLIISFVVVVIGGIGSIKGAFVGALLIGLARVYGQVFLPELSSVTVYALMAAILLWRPAGLYGRV